MVLTYWSSVVLTVSASCDYTSSTVVIKFFEMLNNLSSVVLTVSTFWDLFYSG